jgi:hypothetical protein
MEAGYYFQEPVVLGIDLLGTRSQRRFRRLLLVPYLLHPCSRALAGERPITPSLRGPLAISLHRTTMRLDIGNFCARSPTLLATIT